MIIAIASGKGGTGKTTVCASLAQVWGTALAAVDLDVEEPNLHLFLQPENLHERVSCAEVPIIHPGLCTACKKCADFCQFKAISVIGASPVVFPDMCHSCGGCFALCPTGAISAGKRELGHVISGAVGDNPFIMGRLRIGEAMSPPLMRAVKNELAALLAQNPMDVLLDCPPGVSCPAVNAVMDSDVIALVTEPTPFGLHDLALAVQAFSPLMKPMGVIINRAGIGDDEVLRFCDDHALPVLMQIPFERKIAESYSRGQCIAHSSPQLWNVFLSLAKKLRALGENPKKETTSQECKEPGHA